jgi:hypothetical protein
MKKIIVMFLCMTVCGAALFAQEGLFSAGGGPVLQPGFQTMKIKGRSEEQKSSSFGGGINVFFDATYAEANLSLLLGSTKVEDADKGTDTTDLIIGILVKYPFSLTESLALFPFAGVDYRLNLGASYDGTKIEDAGDGINALSLLFGVGADYNITSALYFRCELGFGLTFNSKNEDDRKAFIDSNFKGKIPIKLAVGYRF